MADQSERRYEHILLRNTSKSFNYTYAGGGGGNGETEYPKRDRDEHGKVLLERLNETREQLRQLQARREEAGIEDADGDVLEFQYRPNSDFTASSLERTRSGILLYNKRETSDARGTAAVYVPKGKLDNVQARLERYLDPEKDSPISGKPRGASTWNSIEAIRRARLETLWADPLDDEPPVDDEDILWEVWLHTDRGDEPFLQQAGALDLNVSPSRLEFPARIIRLVRATPQKMAECAELTNAIAELRRARPIIQEFLELPKSDQTEFIDELAERITRPWPDAPAVCALDAGVDYQHPLLQPGIDPEDCDTYDPNWSPTDHRIDAHGSQMAGFALYGRELEHIMRSNTPVELENRVESVKIMPPRGQHPEELDGEITQSAVYKAETNNPNRNRVFSLAVTRLRSRNGRPSVWSAAIDQICAEFIDGDQTSRLFIVSAGNADWQRGDYSYPDANIVSPIDNPGQSWNALTVGAFTERVQIMPQHGGDFRDWRPIAPTGGLSPTTRTGQLWDTDAPNKPDLVMEGGNLAWRPDSDIPSPEVDSLWMLTTGRWAPGHSPLRASGETSGAAYIVARMAARLQGRYPHLWPETIRALLVHSARWTDQMRDSVPDDVTGRKEMRYLLRCYGYGVPDFQRAARSAANDTVLVVQDELKPFKREGSSGKTDQMRLHKLPWPDAALHGILEEDVRLRITLSYFVEPNPGPDITGSASTRKRYNYPSAGLRFDVKTARESDEQFKKRVNKNFRAEDEGSNSSSRIKEWRLGYDERNRGSIHSDVWTGSGAELLNRGLIAVYPVSGWWRYNKSPDRIDQKIRYSLVVSIETDETEIDVDFYSAIEQQLTPEITV